MRKLAIGAVLLGLLAGPVYGQQKPDNALSDAERVKKAESDLVDRLYQTTLDRDKSAAAPQRVDPWSNMRGSDNSSPKTTKR